MERKINDIQFSQMPHTEGMVSFGDRIIMYDNLDKPMSEAFNRDIQLFVSDLPKRIDFVIILLCVQGEINITCNLRDYCAKANDLIVLVPGTICEKLNISDDARVVMISLPDNSYAPGLGFEDSTYAAKNFTTAKCISIDSRIVSNGITIYTQLKSHMSSLEHKVSEDLIKAYILVFAGLAAGSVKKAMKENTDGSVNSKEEILKNFLESIDKNHREHRDVSFYAGEAGLSPKYFAKIIYSISGKHPLDWIKGNVILDAKVLLKSREHSIEEICNLLNFSTRSQFNRYFKDETGMSPVEYIKSDNK